MKFPLIVLLCALLAVPLFAEVRVERVIRDTETVTAEESALGLKIVRTEFYTYKTNEDKDLDSAVVWIYQKDTNSLIVRHKLKTAREEIMDAVWNISAVTDTVRHELDW